MSKKAYISLKTGFLATIAMTLLMFLAPMMGMPKMAIGSMLADFMHVPSTVGWAMHFMIGIVLAGSYVFIFRSRFPGSAVLRGVLFSLIPFGMAQMAAMPMMGAGFFSIHTPAPVLMVMGSMMGHLVYGSVLGLSAK